MNQIFKTSQKFYNLLSLPTESKKSIKKSTKILLGALLMIVLLVGLSAAYQPESQPNDSLTSQIESKQKINTDNPIFSIDVMSCSEYGTKSIKIQASIKNNDSVSHSPEMIFYLHDADKNVISFWDYTERNLNPGQTVFIEGYPDNKNAMTGCGLKILKIN